jgi:thiol-disulfide isomerase/thioredoxin
LSRIETWYGKRLAELEVEDGKTYWDYTASSKYLLKQASFPWFMQMNGYMIEPFLNVVHERKAPEYVAVSSEATPTSFHGHLALRVEVRREGKPKEPNKGSDELYMDSKTGLPIGATLHWAGVNYITEYVFEDLKIGKPIDHAAFEYQPQVAANTDQMEDLLPVGTKAPLFRGTALGEKPFDLATTVKGAKAVILNFWGLGCPGCRSELPKLQKLQNRFGAKGLRVVTFQLVDDNKILKSFLKEAHLDLTTVFEGTCKPSAVDAAYRGSMAEPVTYLIDGKGMIVDRFIGDDVTQLTKDLASLGLKD